MPSAFDDNEFKRMVKETLTEARSSAQRIVFSEDVDDSIKELRRLLEAGDEFGDVGADVSFGDFAKTMGDPGKVAKSATGAVAKVGVKTRSLLSKIIAGVPSLVIPFISARYDRIVAKEKSAMARLRQKYPSVFSNADQLFTDDAKMVAFLVNPALMMGAIAAKASAEAALGLAGALSDGNDALTNKIDQLMQGLATKNRQAPGAVSQMKKQRVVPKGNEDLYYIEGKRLTEATRSQKEVNRLFKDPDFIQQVAKASVTQDIKHQSETIINELLNEIIDLADAFRRANNVEDLERIDPTLVRDLVEPERGVDKAEFDNVASSVIKKIKETAVNELRGRVKSFIDALRQAQVPQNAEVYKAFGRALQRLTV